MTNPSSGTAVAEQPAERPREAAVPRAAGRPSLWLSVATLWLREIRGFYRQRSRVVGGLATPLVFWLLLGSGFANSLRTSEAARGSSLEFFFPGMVTLVILFTAIFSNISVIEDRREGFMLSVLVAPVSRMALVLGKVLGATTIGLLQGLVFLPLLPLAGVWIDPARLPLIFATLLVMSLGLTCLGFFFAWWLNSVQGFHSVMNVVLMPLWLLSGAVFPPEGAAVWVRWVVKANPLSYGVTALRRLFSDGQPVAGASLEVCFAVIFAFSLAALLAAFLQANRTSARNLA